MNYQKGILFIKVNFTTKYESSFIRINESSLKLKF